MKIPKSAERDVDDLRVPAALKSLVPTVRKIGFSDQFEQDDFASNLNGGDESTANMIVQEMEAAREDIRKWRQDLTGSDASKIQQLADDITHPYWIFLDALKTSELIHSDAVVDSKALERTRMENLKILHAEDAARAELLFREKEYVEYVELMEKYEGILDKASLAKLRIAKKKAET